MVEWLAIKCNKMIKVNQNELNSMAAFSKILILSWWLLFITSRFAHLIISPNITIEPLKHSSMEIQEVISNIVITEKNGKLCQTTGIQRNLGTFLDKVTPDIDGFTDEPVVKCDVQVIENTFMGDSK